MKMLFADYDPFTGVSTVALQKGNDIFVGTAKLHEDDADIASAYIGCYFAELKAIIKMKKKRYQQFKAELKVLEEFKDRLEYMRDAWEYEYEGTFKQLKKQIYVKRRQVAAAKAEYELMEDAYPQLVEDRLKASRQLPERLKEVGKRDIKWIELENAFGDIDKAN